MTGRKIFANFFVCIFFLVFAISLFAIKEPEEPKPPVIEIDDPDKKNDNKKEDLYSYTIEAELKKGSFVLGQIKLKINTLNLKSDDGDFVYEKDIKFDELSSIEIVEWEGKSSSKETKKYIQYTFYPKKYRLTTKDGKIYYYKKRIKELDEFYLYNNNGKTKLYSFFVDYWVIKEDNKSGYWYINKSNNFNIHIKNPHPKTLVKISFKNTKKG